MERKSMLALCGPPTKRKVSDNSAIKVVLNDSH